MDDWTKTIKYYQFKNKTGIHASSTIVKGRVIFPCGREKNEYLLREVMKPDSIEEICLNDRFLYIENNE